MRRRWMTGVFAAALITYSEHAGAWLYHEHTAIGRTAVQSLPAGEAETLRAAWAIVQGASRGRLCVPFGEPDTNFVLGPSAEPPATGFCADFPMLAAAAGDFSCAPDDLWTSVVESAWAPRIARAAHLTEAAILAATGALPERADAGEIREAWHDNHLQNFQIDPDYLARARGNLAHFLWPRAGDSLESYLAEVFRSGRAPNAAAFYAIHHVSAVRFAHRAASLPPGQEGARPALLRSMFLSEATALHYLQDGFSAGHGVGRAGDSRDRAGTHDYYCEHGVEGRLWPAGRGETRVSDTYLAHGDAFMRAEDQRHAAVAVRMSLRDLAHVLAVAPTSREILTSAKLAPAERIDADSMDACLDKGLDRVPPWLAVAAEDPWIWSVLRLTTMPSLATSAADAPGTEGGELPTTAPVFPSDMGVFVGAFAAVRQSGVYGLGTHGAQARFPASGDAGAELGLGADGIATSQSDAMILLSLGGTLQSAEIDAPFAGRAIAPARMGFSARLRIPFRFVPVVELAYMLPGLALGSLGARRWLVSAAESGFFGLERQWSTGSGTFQVVALREIGLRYLTAVGGTDASASLEFPLLELKPQRWYAGSMANSFTVQLGVALDLGQTTASVGGFLRFGLDVRRYLSNAL